MPQTQFKADCPHCLTRSAGFAIVHQWPHRNAGNHAYIIGQCGLCNNGVIVHAIAHNNSSFPDLTRNSVDFIRPKYEMRNFWPSRSIDVPENLPKNVENFYLQGLESLRAERWDAAGAMFRKSLDVGTKLISPELKSESLFSRINTLVERHLLTEAMGQWSHEIRIDGNGAVHDELPETESDANAIQKFTEAFLRYAFTLPSMVAQNRSKRDEKSPANESEKSAG